MRCSIFMPFRPKSQIFLKAIDRDAQFVIIFASVLRFLSFFVQQDLYLLHVALNFNHAALMWSVRSIQTSIILLRITESSPSVVQIALNFDDPITHASIEVIGISQLILKTIVETGSSKIFFKCILYICPQLFPLLFALPKRIFQLLHLEWALKMSSFQFSQPSCSILEQGSLFCHFLSQFSLEEFNIVDIVVINFAFRFEFIEFHLHRLIVDLQFFHQLSIALVLLEKPSVFTTRTSQFLLQT